jgi:hypothetical protein
MFFNISGSKPINGLVGGVETEESEEADVNDTGRFVAI